jgi:hypothetical protein
MMRAWAFVPFSVCGCLAACGGAVQDGASHPDASPAGATGDAAAAFSDASTPSYTCAEAREASAGATPLPLGVYTNCTGSAVDSNESAGGDATGTLTLTETSGVLSVALGEGLFAIAPGSLGFTPLTNGAAVVTPGQSYGLLVVPCATSTAETGALALDGSSLVLSLLGQGCGNPIAGFVECPLPAQPTGELHAADLCDAADAAAQAFPRGTYAQCTPSIPGYGGGSVTLSESGGVWTAAVQGGATGVSAAEPSLTFSPSSSSSALVASGQMLFVQEDGWGTSCSGPPPNDSGLIDDPGPVTRTMTIENGWLVVDGSTLFVFLGGTDECGSAVQESFNCTAQ